MNKKLLISVGIVILIIGFLIGSYFMFRSPWKFREERPVKILWINSYHDYPWTNGQIEGFMEVFKKEGIEVELKKFNMNSKNKNSEKEKQDAGKNAKELIESWTPDLIYAIDDNAQKYVVVDYIDSDIPIVFSGVNREPEFYGFEKSKNIMGVLERYPFSQAIDLIKQLYPYAKKVAIISDSGTSGIGGMDYIMKESSKISFMEFVAFDLVETFDEFKVKVGEYQDKADVIVFRGLDTFKKNEFESFTQKEITEWFVKNSDLPEISFWSYFIDYGALASVTVSGNEQGKAAGKIAYEILIKGKKPSSFDFEPTKIGDKYLNLARARTLGINKEDISSTILINSEIIENFPWEEK